MEEMDVSLSTEAPLENLGRGGGYIYWKL